jgi:tight adherence protein C
VNALVLVLAAASFVGALVILADTVSPRARRRHAAVDAVHRVSGFAGRRPRKAELSPLVATAGEAGRRLATARFRERLPQRLAAAGLAGRVSPEAFLALRLGLTAVGVLGGLCLGTVAHLGGRTVLLTAALGTAAFLAPTYVLERKARSRRQSIHDELPDALDLLAVTVEAGLGLHASMARIAQTAKGPLADELALVLTELRVGDSSERALQRMAKRLQSQEVESLVRSLVQGEQLGLKHGQ